MTYPAFFYQDFTILTCCKAQLKTYYQSNPNSKNMYSVYLIKVRTSSLLSTKRNLHVASVATCHWIWKKHVSQGTGHWANCSCTDLWNLRSTGRITPQAFWKQLDPKCVTEMFVQVNSLKHFVGGGRFNCGCREKLTLVFYRIYLMLRFPRP